jgi:hypothetical protein
MASKVTDNVVAGDILIIKELSKHLKYSQEERKFMIRLAKKGAIAVETLLEEAISKIGKIERCIQDGQDFKDKSDAKKGIVHFHSHGANYSTVNRECNIGNVIAKNGKLRIMIADNLTDELFYFVVPKPAYKGRKNLNIIFNMRGGAPESFKGNKSFNYAMWNKYRVNSFKEMCQL